MMARLVAVTLTEQAVRSRRKTVTRLLGWSFLRPGERLVLCRKVTGGRAGEPGEPLVRLTQVEVANVRREPAGGHRPRNVAAEDFPDWSRDRFIAFFCAPMRCRPSTKLTWIEWRYLDNDMFSDQHPPAGR